MSVVFYKDDNFSLSYTEFNNVYFLHCEYASWKLSSFKKGLEVFNSLHRYALDNGISCLISVTPNPRFCQLFAGYKINEVEHENETYEVYKWDLIQ